MHLHRHLPRSAGVVPREPFCQRPRRGEPLREAEVLSAGQLTDQGDLVVFLEPFPKTHLKLPLIYDVAVFLWRFVPGKGDGGRSSTANARGVAREGAPNSNGLSFAAEST